jgi:hypothetical protein
VVDLRQIAVVQPQIVGSSHYPGRAPPPRLSDLEKLSKRQSRVVELRYFGGLTVEETAMVLEVSTDTVMRDWSMARTWLHRALESGK